MARRSWIRQNSDDSMMHRCKFSKSRDSGYINKPIIRRHTRCQSAPGAMLHACVSMLRIAAAHSSSPYTVSMCSRMCWASFASYSTFSVSRGTHPASVIESAPRKIAPVINRLNRDRFAFACCTFSSFLYEGRAIRSKNEVQSVYQIGRAKIRQDEHDQHDTAYWDTSCSSC